MRPNNAPRHAAPRAVRSLTMRLTRRAIKPVTELIQLRSEPEIAPKCGVSDGVRTPDALSVLTRRVSHASLLLVTQLTTSSGHRAAAAGHAAEQRASGACRASAELLLSADAALLEGRVRVSVLGLLLGLLLVILLLITGSGPPVG